MIKKSWKFCFRRATSHLPVSTRTSEQTRKIGHFDFDIVLMWFGSFEKQVWSKYSVSSSIHKYRKQFNTVMLWLDHNLDIVFQAIQDIARLLLNHKRFQCQFRMLKLYIYTPFISWTWDDCDSYIFIVWPNIIIEQLKLQFILELKLFIYRRRISFLKQGGLG